MYGDNTPISLQMNHLHKLSVKTKVIPWSFFSMRFQSYFVIKVFTGMLNYKCKRPLKVNNINVLTPNKKTF